MDIRIARSGEQRWKRCYVFLLPLLLQLALVTVPAHAADETDRKWMIAPYVWGPNVKGDVGIGGLSVPLDVGVKDLGSGIKLGAMGYVRWTRDLTFIYAEGLGLDFKDKSFAAFFDQRVHSQVVFAELGVGRHFRWDVSFPTRGELQLSPYIGGRYVWLNVKASNPLQSLEADDDWQDLALGAILQAPLHGKLSYLVKADAAGFNFDHDRYWNFIGGVSYDFTPGLSGVLAYRISRFHADQGGGNELDLNLRAAGPLLGMSFQF